MTVTQRHKRIIPLSAHARKPKPRISHADKLRFLSQYKRISDPSNRKSVDKQYRTYKKFPLYLQRSANESQRRELKKRGFFTTDKGVIIDGPRDARRKPIKGAKLSIQKDGTVKWSVKDRRDYIVGLTRKEKQEFAVNPNALIKRKLEELKRNNPTLAKSRNIQVRLQWGAYQATKDFHAAAFTKRYGHEPEKQIKDRLTGLHFVIHSKRSAAHLSGIHFTTKAKRAKKKSSHRNH